MIYISHSRNIKKILIENSISDEGDIDRLYKELRDEDDQTLFEITFIEIKSIPASIVKELHKIKERVTITTTQRTLWQYLLKLGIKNSYKNSFNDTFATSKYHIKAVALGGSAGSLEKIISIMETIPFSDISIFIVMHILPDKKSHLVEILQKRTDYKVYEAKHNMRCEPNCIYIAPPDHHLIVIDG
ncbi:MAG: hypothetical protein K8R44_04060, partial [Sulfurimonas sp.]|nr:hypothetical protein [Sulfurimonas sp.]